MPINTGERPPLQSVMAPQADFNLLKFPDKNRAPEKIEDFTPIFPVGYDGALKAESRLRQRCTGPAPVLWGLHAPLRASS
jgi:hypothetical protein